MNKKLAVTLVCTLFFIMVNAQDADSIRRKHIEDSTNAIKAKATELWSPEPPIVTPGNTPQDAPSDAVILFDGKNLDAWRSVKDTTKPADWTVADGVLTVNKKAGNIELCSKELGNDDVLCSSKRRGSNRSIQQAG